jgi:hypothetical protein
MRRTRHSIAITIWLVLAACGRSPSAPSSSGPGAPSAGATITAVQVTGPARLSPGERAQYVAIATYSDGSSRDVSSIATWSPANPSAVLYFGAPGRAVGVRAGEATVFTRIGVVEGRTPVLVLERGTFKLAGRIVETSDRPLEGISVDVLSGIGFGRRATANSQGEYALYGVAGPIQLRVSGEGFGPQLRDTIVTADSSAEHFILSPAEPAAASIGGDWTMTLRPSATCSVAPGEVAKGRSYLVTIHQTGTGLTYTIGGPTVTAHTRQYNTGALFGSHVRLQFIGDTDYGDWSSGSIVDRMSATEMMQFNGMLEGELKDATITATMSGDIVYWDSTRPSFVPNWYCRAKDHVVILRR